MALEPALADIKDAWDKNTGGGRDEYARVLADEYVAANPGYFESLKELDLPAVVKTVEVFRDAGLENEYWRAITWHLHKYAPQNIGGTVEAPLRVPGLG